MSIVIKVENLSKKYIIRHEKNSVRYETFSETLIHVSKNIAKKIIHPFSGREIVPQALEDFWALKDINFEIRQGDKVGIIGRNGAGKSTLLKVLSRITVPTLGEIHINGRMASLLEVGTGFHPELTGRENIFLNGAILGMSRVEIKKKFDEIVDFAEIEKFLDTPVKRYSSGMYVRLAFAVAAFLEPEILIVDEVLAVGDAQFQKKCLNKMNEAGEDGRTILFVSHNMGMISQICSKCIWLEKGYVQEIGETKRIINSYLLHGISEFDGEIVLQDDVEKKTQLKKVQLFNHAGEITQKFDCNESITIRFDILVRESIRGLYGYIGINKPDGTVVLVSDSFDGVKDNPVDNLPVGISKFEVTIPHRTLGHGDYTLHFSFASHLASDFHVDIPGVVCTFSLHDFTSKRGNQRAGYFSTLLGWERCA